MERRAQRDKKDNREDNQFHKDMEQAFLLSQDQYYIYTCFQLQLSSGKLGRTKVQADSHSLGRLN
jgi:hypothetical protein